MFNIKAEDNSKINTSNRLSFYYINNEKNLILPQSILDNKKSISQELASKDKEARLSRILSPTRFRPAPQINNLLSPIQIENSQKACQYNSNIASPTGSYLSSDTSTSTSMTTSSPSSTSFTSSTEASSPSISSYEFNQKTSSPKFLISSNKTTQIEDVSQCYEHFDPIQTIYDNQNNFLSTSDSSSSSCSPLPPPPPLPASFVSNRPVNNSQHKCNLINQSHNEPNLVMKNQTHASMNNRLFFNFNHNTSTLNQNYLNSLGSTPNSKYQTQSPLDNKRYEANKFNNNNNNMIKILKDTASLLSESVNSCSPNGLNNNLKKTNETSSPTANLKHRDSFMKRIFNRTKSKEKPTSPLDHVKYKTNELVNNNRFSNATNCTYVTMNDTNEFTNLTSSRMPTKTSSTKKTGKNC